jgi:hypothetical protein
MLDNALSPERDAPSISSHYARPRRRRAPHGSVCLLLDLGDRVKLHPDDVCAIGRARVGMSGGMEGGACAARGHVRHARTCSPYNPYPRPHRSRGRQSTSVPTVSLQGDGEVSKRRIGAVDASTQVAASAAWDRAKDATSAAREAFAYEIESLRRGRRPVSHTPASARYSQCTCPRFPQPAGQRGMRAVSSEGTRAGAVAHGFSNAPAPTLSSGRAFAAYDMVCKEESSQDGARSKHSQSMSVSRGQEPVQYRYTGKPIHGTRPVTVASWRALLAN